MSETALVVSRRYRRVRADEEPKQSLVGVRVPQHFHRRIHRECRRRGMSLKEMVIDALQDYFRKPIEDWDYQTESAVTVDEQDKAAEHRVWTDIWSRYVTKMPREKIDLIVKAMEWDLEAMRTSRRKSVRTPKPALIEGGS